MGERLRFTRLSGTGPSTGWISLWLCLNALEASRLEESEGQGHGGPKRRPRPHGAGPRAGPRGGPGARGRPQGGEQRGGPEWSFGRAVEAPLGDVSFDDDEDAGQEAAGEAPPEPTAEPKAEGSMVGLGIACGGSAGARDAGGDRGR